METFSRSTIWDFDIASHPLVSTAPGVRMSGRILLTPTCGPWNWNARDPEQPAKLLEHREWHHGTPLALCERTHPYRTTCPRSQLCYVSLGSVAHFSSVPMVAVAWIKMAASPQKKQKFSSRPRYLALYQQLQLVTTTTRWQPRAFFKPMPKGSECEPSTWRTINLPLPPFWLQLFWPTRFRRSALSPNIVNTLAS